MSDTPMLPAGTQTLISLELRQKVKHCEKNAIMAQLSFASVCLSSTFKFMLEN